MNSTSKLATVSQAITGAVLLLALFWAVAAFGGASATAQATPVQTEADGISLSGPSAAALGQSVIYSVVFTVSQNDTWFLTYRYPAGFTVTGRTPGALNVNNSLIWNPSNLGATRTVTVTGRHNLGSCPSSEHQVALGDIYDPGAALPSARLVTLVSNVHCQQLPMVNKQHPGQLP